MNILIIGGTRFQGRYLIRELMSYGFNITVFNRGNFSFEQENEITTIFGDRNNPEDLKKLKKLTFDWCIDNCAYFPEQIQLLKKFINTNHYLLISSVYAYEDRDALINESSKLLHLDANFDDKYSPLQYGALKAHCEEIAHIEFGKNVLIIRPSAIIGINDHTERLLFWFRIISLFGKRLEITDIDPVFQPLDVTDLTHFISICVAEKKIGTVNVCGKSIKFSGFLDYIASISGVNCEIINIKLHELKKTELTNLPYLYPIFFAEYDISKALSWGFSTRNLKSSLFIFFEHYRKHDFESRKFLLEEKYILNLFEFNKPISS